MPCSASSPMSSGSVRRARMPPWMAWVQALDAPAQDLGESGHVRDVDHRDALVAERAGRAAGRQQLDAERVQAATEVDQARLVADGEEGAADRIAVVRRGEVFGRDHGVGGRMRMRGPSGWRRPWARRESAKRGGKGGARRRGRGRRATRACRRARPARTLARRWDRCRTRRRRGEPWRRRRGTRRRGPPGGRGARRSPRRRTRAAATGGRSGFVRRTRARRARGSS